MKRFLILPVLASTLICQAKPTDAYGSFLLTPEKNYSRKEKIQLKNELARTTKNKLVKNMQEDELEKAAKYAIQLKNFDDALIFFEQLIITTNSINCKKNAQLHIADIYFEKGLLKKAAEQYNEYIDTYPGDKHVDYACYKGILSNHFISRSPDRDQTATRKTRELCTLFLSKDNPGKYAQEVATILTQCDQKLFDHELNVFDFYFTRKRYKAAQTRLNNIKKTYESKLAGATPKIMYCQYQLAKAQKQTEYAQELLASLEKRFPRYAQSLTAPKKMNYLIRF